MIPFLLGLAWLVLTPVCVWLLFARDRAVPTRVTAASTLAALQTGTLLVAFAAEPAEPPAPARAAPPAPAPPPRAEARPCPPRVPTPEAVRLRRHGNALGLTVFWRAATPACPTAMIALRHTGRVLRLSLSEGAAVAARKGTREVPVRVQDGLASLELRLTPRPPRHRRLVAVDAHTGDRIPTARRPGRPARG